MRLRKPTPAFVVAVGALVVSLGGTSYAAVQLGSSDIRDGSLRGVDIRNGSITRNDVADGTLTGNDILNGSVKARDLAPGVLKSGGVGETGPAGPQGAPGAPGEDGADGTGRWALVDASGAIVDQSGGFTVAAAYVTLPNTATAPADNSLRAAGNVYINANEDLSNNGIVVSIALQNQADQNGDSILNGRAPGPDANPEFSGEISSTLCGVAMVVACAPPGTNNTSHFVVSPRNSDGSVTGAGTHKRFYVIITGDSSDQVS